jgi:hypothetical protein
MSKLMRRVITALGLGGAALLLIAWPLSHLTTRRGCHPSIFCEGPLPMRFGSVVLVFGLVGISALFVAVAVPACVLAFRGLRALIRLDAVERQARAGSERR